MAIRVGDGVVRIIPDFKGFRAAVERDVNSTLRRVGERADALGRSLLPLSLLSAGFLAVATKEAVNFERGLAKIQALVGETTSNIEALSVSVLDLAGEVGRAPAELVDALFFVESAGLRGSDAFNVLRESARSSAAGLGETKSVADALTSAMNAYALSGLSASRANDVLVATIREGKLETDTLSASIGRVIPIASQLGVSFDQVGAAIAAATKVGLSAEEATTALRQALVILLKPSAEAQATLEEFGFTAAGLRRTLKEDGLLATLQLLRNSFGDNQDAMNKVFQNVRALTGVFALVGENAGQVQKVFDELEGSTGDADAAFQVITETAQFQLQQAFAGLRAAMVEFGLILLPTVKGIAGFLKGLADGFKNLPGPIKATVVAALGLTAISAPLLLLVGRVATLAASLEILRTRHQGAATAALGQAEAEGVLGATVASTTGAVNARNASSVLGGPILLRAAKGLGLALGGVMAGSLVQGIQTAENTTADRVKDFFGNALRGAGIGAAAGSLIPIPGLTALVGGVGGAVVGGLTSLFGSSETKDEVETSVEEMLQPRPKSIAEIIETGRALGREITIAADEALKVGDVVDKAFEDAQQKLNDRLDDVRGELTRFATQTPDILSTAFEEIPEIIFENLQKATATELQFFTETQNIVDRLNSLSLVGISQLIADADPAEALAVARVVNEQLLTDPDSVFTLNEDILRLTPELAAGFRNFIGAMTLSEVDQGRLGLTPGIFTDFFDAMIGQRPLVAEAMLAALPVDNVFRDALQERFRFSLEPAFDFDDQFIQQSIDQAFIAVDFPGLLSDLALTASETGEFVIGIDGQVELVELEGADELAAAAAERAAQFQLPVTSPITGRVRLEPLPTPTAAEIQERRDSLVASIIPETFVQQLSTDLQTELTTWGRENFPGIVQAARLHDPDIDIDTVLLDAMTRKLRELTATEVADKIGRIDVINDGLNQALVEGFDPTLFAVDTVPDVIAEALQNPVVVSRVFEGAKPTGEQISGGVASGFAGAWVADAEFIRNIIAGTRFTVPVGTTANPGAFGGIVWTGDINNTIDIENPTGESSEESIDNTLRNPALVGELVSGVQQGG